MPRKSTKKAAKETPSNDVAEDVKDLDQESTLPRSGRADRSRRSSTAAQTAASEADSKGSKGQSSPSEGRRSSARERESNIESPATRVKSSRRAASRINYKESDGEEDVSTPKTEETFESNDDFEDSGSDAVNKRSSRRTKPSTRGRGAKQKAKTPGRRGRKPKKGETVVVTDESADDHSESEKKDKSESSQKSDEDEKEELKSNRKKQKKSTEKPGRRSTRAPVKETPVSKRPSRNKQIKKYTEVDEDFSEKSEDDEVVYETEVKKETSRKRKREAADDSSNAKQKKQRISKPKSDDDEEVEVSDTEVTSEKDATLVDNAEEEKSAEFEKSEVDPEPMEIDDSEANENIPKEEENENDSKIKTVEKEESKQEEEKVNAPGVDEKIVKKSELDGKVENKDSDSKKDNLPKDEMDDTQHGEESLQDSEEIDDSVRENNHSSNDESDELSKSTEDNKASDSKTPVNCIDSKSENTFPSKEITSTESPINGENVKPDVIASCPSVPTPDRILQTNSDLPPKQNGSHEKTDSPQNFLTSRRYVINASLDEEIRLSLKEKTFGIASYNLQGSEAVNKEKLVQELSKLQASIICFQDVSRALYHEVLESNLDILGFKGVGSWLKGSQHTGLATFYKTSAFRLNTTVEKSLQKLVEQEIDVTNINENNRESFYRSLNKCGNALILVLSAVLGDRQLIVGNVDLPSSNINLHTIQTSCLSQELIKISEGVKKPLVLCGELNMVEYKIPYQLLQCGNLTETMLEELKSKAENIPEAMAFENSLKKASLRPSCKLLSCYATVLGKELSVPSTQVTSSNLVWFSPDCLHTIGVLDVTPDSPDADDYPISLKADIAFSV